MQNNQEIIKINCFLAIAQPIVVSVLKTMFQSLGLEVKKEGSGLDLAFSIKSGEKEVKFYLHNLLLEIVSIDRDEKPLRFDEGLRDFEYFLAKTARLTESKLNILFRLLGEENVDAAIEKINQCAKQYERIRIWRFDKKPI